MPKTMKDYMPHIKPIVIRNSTTKSHKIKRRLTLCDRFINHDRIRRLKNSELSHMGRKSKRKFVIERTIDLHGLTQNEAFHSLLDFFTKCQSEKVRKILVITGGNPMKESVLRNSFQKWIHDSFGDYVVSCSQSNLRHGGLGAFYVVLKFSDNMRALFNK